MKTLYWLGTRGLKIITVCLQTISAVLNTLPIERKIHSKELLFANKTEIDRVQAHEKSRQGVVPTENEYKLTIDREP